MKKNVVLVKEMRADGGKNLSIEPSPGTLGPPTDFSIFSNGMLTARINKQPFGEKINNK
jgi:hypothetical protein